MVVKNHRIKLCGFSASILMLSYSPETLRSEELKNILFAGKSQGKNATLTTGCKVLEYSLYPFAFWFCFDSEDKVLSDRNACCSGYFYSQRYQYGPFQGQKMSFQALQLVDF